MQVIAWKFPCSVVHSRKTTWAYKNTKLSRCSSVWSDRIQKRRRMRNGRMKCREVNLGWARLATLHCGGGKGGKVWEDRGRAKTNNKNKQTKRQDSVWPFEIMDISHVRDMPLAEGSTGEISFRWRSEERHFFYGKGEQVIFIFWLICVV